MDTNQRTARAGSMGVKSYRAYTQEGARSSPDRQPRQVAQTGMGAANSLSVGAKTVAGIGIGLIAVVGGAALLGVAAEAVLIPSLLVKLAGGIAGGGLGMAKGLKDANKAN